MIVVHEKRDNSERPGIPVLINTDRIELVYEFPGSGLSIRFDSGREIDVQETMEEFLAELEEVKKIGGKEEWERM